MKTCLLLIGVKSGTADSGQRTATFCGGPDGPGNVVISCILGDTMVEDTCDSSDPSAAEESEKRAEFPVPLTVGGLAVVCLGGLAAVARRKLRK